MNSSSQAPQLEEIYNSLGSQLKRYLVSRLKNDTLADDLLQEIFLKIHKNIDALKDVDEMPNWIYRVAHNVVIDHFRSSTADKLTALPANSDFIDEASLPVPNSSGKLDLSVRMMIEQLPEPYREALLLTTYEGVKQHELAHRKGISVSAAKSRVQRGRQKLKEMLLDCCHFEFDRYGTLLNYEARKKPVCCEQRLHTVRPLLGQSPK